jgi:DNA-binding response OmpR family regulator
MYRRLYHIVVLDHDERALHQTVAVLKTRDYMVLGAGTVDQARVWLSEWPVDLLIAGVRLRGIGGLQFITAARDRYPELAGILVGDETDRALDMDAWRHRVPLVIRPIEPASLLMVVAEQLASIRRRQRWPRKVVASNVPVTVAGSPAALIDVSYGGLRFALDRETYELPSPLMVDLPAANLRVRAELVWSARGRDGISSLCGAAIVDDAATADWRRFVDRVPDAGH